MSFAFFLIWNSLLHYGISTHDNYTIRLNGSNPVAGRVEIYYNGQWGTVCDDYWDLDDAMVVCRQLGFKTASQALRSAWFGEGAGPIYLDNVACTGNETSLDQCSFISDHNCAHYEDAGVRCVPNVRLSGGSTTTGRVEVSLHNQWGTICDDKWDLPDAMVVCRQLGFRSASRAFTYGGSLENIGPIHAGYMDCTGSEISILDCDFISKHNCQHNEDAGLSCLPYEIGDIRLHGNPERVQIFFDSDWHYLGSSIMHSAVAKVVCRQLGYDELRGIHAAGDKIPMTENLICEGYESNLHECLYFSWFEVANLDDDVEAYVNCSNSDKNSTPSTVISERFSTLVTHETRSCDPVGKVRLSNGNDTAGRVEICLNEEWGTVCDDDWGLEDAEVVCRQLGHMKASSAPLEAFFGEGGGPIHLAESRCFGHETTLLSCSHSRRPNCHHKEDASVVCAPLEISEVSRVPLVLSISIFSVAVGTLIATIAYFYLRIGRQRNSSSENDNSSTLRPLPDAPVTKRCDSLQAETVEQITENQGEEEKTENHTGISQREGTYYSNNIYMTVIEPSIDGTENYEKMDSFQKFECNVASEKE